MHTTSLKLASNGLNENDRVIIAETGFDWASLGYDKATAAFITKETKSNVNLLMVTTQGGYHFFVTGKKEALSPAAKETWRKLGSKLCYLLVAQKRTSVFLENTLYDEEITALVLEGLLLANYDFDKYKKKKSDATRLKEVKVAKEAITDKLLKQLEIITDATLIARDLVNEPLSYLTAEQLAEEVTKLGETAGFAVEVLNKTKIKSLKMGGLIAVNLGSTNPPTFSILEWKPAKAKNKQPIVLVGKGVVYDTGGLSLKPTTNSMDYMKSDMAGAAAIAGTIYAVAKAKLPVHVIGLIPATENRPGGNAYVPGDVVKMHSGLCVEVLNTDAEGRMILADALSYAKKYKPELVIDVATLTGAAARAIGSQGIVYMGTAGDEVKNQLEYNGLQVHERLVEFPLWDEYDEYIKSDIADIKNIGGEKAGAITAGMFLKYFTDYPWLHLDIAGMAYFDRADAYRSKNATGVGVRLLFDFLKSRAAR
ncbi:MAG: leucyl aminopeptidase [Chitinophagales bacterium]|nr:leucyl aminopeptidase [Chitinophagales bacterium]